MVLLLPISCSDENQDGRSKQQQQTFPAKSGKQKHQQARQNFQQSLQKSAGGFEFSSTYKSVTRGSFPAGIRPEKEEQSYKKDDKRSQEIRGILCGRITPKVSNSTSQL
jgi:hypothetical protein